MKKFDELLKKVEHFEKLAVYGDRSTFLKSLGQSGDPFGKITINNQALLNKVKQISDMLMDAANNQEPGTSFDADAVRGVAQTLAAYSTPPTNLSSLLGQLASVAPLGGEGSGTKVPNAVRAASQLSAYLRQIYTAPPKPQGQVSGDAKVAVQNAARLIQELTHLSEQDAKGLLWDQNKKNYLDRQGEVNKAWADLKDKLGLEQGVADETNPYADHNDIVNAKYTLPIIQQQMKQLEAISAKMTSSRGSWAGMASPVKPPSV